MASKTSKNTGGRKAGKDGVFRLPAMTKKETDALLKSGQVCRMALNDAVRPYLICLDYVYTGGKMYFHFADYGRKMDLIRKDPNVSVELDSYNKSVTKYQNATFMGKLAPVTDAAEKKRAAAALVKSIRPPTGAKKVAARHGYEKLDESLFASSDSRMMRLDVEEQVALKSPDS